MKLEEIKIIKETEDLSIFTAKENGKSLFFKKPKTKNGIIMNTRESNNQKFLINITQGYDVGFEFLEPKLEDNAIVYPDVNQFATFLAKSENPKDNHALLSDYIEEMIKFIKFTLQIPYSDIPEEIKIDSQIRKENIWNKFNIDSEFVIAAGLITKNDISKIRSLIEGGLERMAFQHHDLVPWHMARKTNDQKLILIDSGWSGWSLKYYDVAYYVLQMVGYARKKDDALLFLKRIREKLKDNKELNNALAIPFGYRGVRLAAELKNIGKTEEAQDVINTLLLQIKE